MNKTRPCNQNKKTGRRMCCCSACQDWRAVQDGKANRAAKRAKAKRKARKKTTPERKRCYGCGEWSLRFYKRVREWHCPNCLAKLETGP